MKKIIFILWFFGLVGCATPEEIAQMQAERAAEIQQKTNKIRSQLYNNWAQNRDVTFRYDGPDSGEIAAYEYIRKIGGTVVTRGRSEFELEIDLLILDRIIDGCSVQVVARLVDLYAAGRTQKVVALGQGRRSFSSDCRTINERQIRVALDNIE
jgi:hypothetical protein